MCLPILPTINASLNGLAAVFLILGWNAIKKGKKELHKKMMICALITSAIFLISYVTYHALKQGVVTHYQGVGLSRSIYFTILLTHTPLAMIIVPLSIMAIRKAFKQDFEGHKKITRWLWPIWIYVSFTGVLIYLMLYIF